MTATYPTNPTVEMLIGSSWVDITGDCRLGNADSGGGISIARGVPNEGANAEPTALNFTLNNGVSKAPASAGQTGVYSPNNPSGPWFDQLGRNQRVRVGVDRQIDTFSRTLVGDVGNTPDRTVNGDVIPGEEWHITGPAADVTLDGSQLIFAANGGGATRFVSFGNFGDCDIKTRMQVSSRDTEMGIQARVSRSDLPAPVGTTQTFDDGVAGWVSLQGPLVQDTAIKHAGVGSCQLTVTGSPTSAAIAPVVGPTTMWKGPSWTGYKAIPGATYRNRMWVRASIAGTFRQGFSWYDEDGATFRGSAATVDTVVLANTWTLVEMTAIANQDAGYIRPTIQLIGSPPAGTLVWIDQVGVSAVSNLQWYSANFVPGATDQVKFGKVSPGTSRSVATNWTQQLVVNTWYWMRVQMTTQRMRMKMWKDGDPEPTAWYWRYFDDQTINEAAVPQVGEIGLFAGSGTGIVKFDSFQVDIWRAHAEISELPPRWDLSRNDKWVPIAARGILRRLGQGRKDLKSAVSLHLNSYSGLSKGWWPLEDDTGESAGNNVAGGTLGLIQGLSFGTPDLTGTFRLPGVSGYAELASDTSSFSANAIPHTSSGKETYLWFMRLPNLPASEVTVATLTSTGTVRTWKINVQAGGALRVIGTDRSNTTIVDNTVAAWNGNPDLPTGCWLACTLYLFQNGGNVDWALNHHRPGSDTFWTNNGSVAATVGAFTGISFKGSSVLTAAGNFQFTQVMQYAGDLPFVDYDFERAAVAYDGELATSRFIRLCNNAGISNTTTGYSGTSTPMGYQLPAKLVDLLEDCAKVENGILMESRDDFELCLVTRDSLWDRYTHSLDIDQGHLSMPLEPTNDDQQTRNDVTVSRPSGGFRRSIQDTGPLNVNPPETDLDGVGTYDEQTEVNFSTDAFCQSLADFRRARGTLPEPRYPSMHADLTATAYRTAPALAAAILAIDSGDSITLTNPEADYAPREQLVVSYTETLDQMDWDLVFTTLPGTVYRVGVMGYTTRIDSISNYTQASFVSGTDTKLKSTLTGTGHPWVTILASEVSFPFEIEVGGVRLTVKMVGDVLNSNPGFEDGTTNGWVVTSANVTIGRDRFDPKRGVYCGRVQSVAAGTDGCIQDPTTRSVVLPAVDYLVSGWIKTEVAATDLRLAVDWYQANNTTLISTSLPTPITTTANAWTWYSAVVTSPALSAFAALKSRNVFAGASRMWVDDLRIMPVSSYAADPQTLTVTQQPTNNVIRTIPAGKQIRLAQPWRPAW
jgi:hypothetical protein